MSGEKKHESEGYPFPGEQEITLITAVLEDVIIILKRKKLIDRDECDSLLNKLEAI